MPIQSITAFESIDGTQALAVTATASAFPTKLGANTSVVRLFNSGTATMFISFNKVSATAVTNCVVPTAGSAQKSFPLPPYALEVLTIPAGNFIAAISATAGTLYVTEGRGI